MTTPGPSAPVSRPHLEPHQTQLTALDTRPNLREEIVRTLHAAVISGEMRPGITYSAPQLAHQLGVSATPVREAMLDLVKEGLIEAIRNKGFRVIELSERELDELTELRRLIEVPTVGSIAERGIASDVMHRLRTLAADVEMAAQRKDFVTHNKLDLQFHALLLAQHGNENLVKVVTSWRTRSRLYGAAELAERNELAPTLHEHAELLDLIEAGDVPGAEALMTRHIGHTRGVWARRSAESATVTAPDTPR